MAQDTDIFPGLSSSAALATLFSLTNPMLWRCWVRRLRKVVVIHNYFYTSFVPIDSAMSTYFYVLNLPSESVNG